MNLKSLVIPACLLIAACGDAPGDDPAATPPAIPYAQLNHQQRVAFMSTVVMPQLTPIFTAFDAKFKTLSCTTCHGSGAIDGTYAMPSPQIPPLPASEEAFLEYLKDPEHARWSQFMVDKVWPKMADLLQVDKFDPVAHPDGFSCHNCHTLMGP